MTESETLTIFDDDRESWRPQLIPAIRAGIALLGIATAGLVWVYVPAGPDPDAIATTSRSHAIDAALERHAENEVLADSAPQQQVVNGWATVDLLEVVADQLDEDAQLAAASTVPDQRTPALLLTIPVFGGAFAAVHPGLIPARHLNRNHEGDMS